MSVCAVCGLPLEIGDYPCILTSRPHRKGINGAIGDEMWHKQENGFAKPRMFYSKKALDQALAARGLEIRAYNQGPEDKICRRWDTMDPQTLENGRILAERMGSYQGNDPPLEPLPVNWQVRDVKLVNGRREEGPWRPVDARS